jgi:anti-anti-sigma factor
VRRRLTQTGKYLPTVLRRTSQATGGHPAAIARARRRRSPTSNPHGVGCSLTDVSSGQRCVTVAAHGDVGRSSAASFRSQVLSAHVGDPWLIVIDMSDIHRIDHFGLRAIAQSRDALRRLSCDLLIRDPSAAARRMLDRPGLIGLVETGPTAPPT